MRHVSKRKMLSQFTDVKKKKIEAIAQHDYISQTILLFEILTLVEDLQNCILLKMKSTFNIVKKLKKSLF